MEMLIINIKYIAANELNNLIRLVNHKLAVSSDKTSYVSELTTTHLVKQDDVGMTVATGIDTDIGHGDLLS